MHQASRPRHRPPVAAPSKQDAITKLVQGLCYSLLPIGIVLIVIFFVVGDTSARNTALIVVGTLAGLILLCFFGSVLKVLCNTDRQQQQQQQQQRTPADPAPATAGHTNSAFIVSEQGAQPQIFVTQNTNYHFSSSTASVSENPAPVQGLLLSPPKYEDVVGTDCSVQLPPLPPEAAPSTGQNEPWPPAPPSYQDAISQQQQQQQEQQHEPSVQNTTSDQT